MEGGNAHMACGTSPTGHRSRIKSARVFNYGKQRCTACVRYVVQRQLFPQFLETYLPVLRSLQYGNPVLVERDGDPLPKLDFGPLINNKKVEELRVVYTEALVRGAVSL